MTTIEEPIVALGDLDVMLEETHRMSEVDFQEALVMADDVLAASRKQQSAFHEGRALHLRGWARFGAGDVVDAVKDHLHSLDLARKHEDDVGAGRALHALGAVYDTIGESAVALDHYRDALEIHSRTGDQWGAARTRNGLAIGLADGEQFDEAVDMFREVAAAFVKLGDHWWTAIVRVNRCVTQLEHAQNGDLPKAETTALLSATLAECDEIVADSGDLGDSGRSVELYARHCRVGTLLELDQAAAALEELDVTSPLAIQTGEVAVLIELERYTAVALEALGRPEKVFEHLDRAEELSLSCGRDRLLGQSLELRSKVCEDRGDLAGALEALKRFNDVDVRSKNQAGELRAKVFESLVETKRAEIDLDLARTQVEALQAISRERTRMVSAIAHELRNPITTVLGLSSEMCRNWDSLGAEGPELMEMVRAEAEDLANIVEDLLAAGSIEQNTLHVDVSPSQLAPIVDSVLDRADLGDKEATCIGSATAVVDPTRFRQILRNLVTNAVRYGGDTISVSLAEEGDTAVVEVRDDGVGIPEDDRTRVFEPYQRGSGVDHGTKSIGLGLAVTCQLARLMGGDISYDFVDDHSVFRVTLPKAP